ncbi:long-chain-fatty-acid--CoA ligase [Streptomyces griseoaurantiacus]|uniref:long-chain-fatty-acid--CoA ligase n=1 Tax=Streptomyces griseoaurantiacus TaxID=68213 RepID=UPI0017804412|nr:AMP-dependent synthetase [Streptomyces griseoaurantiacus]
MSLSLAAVLAEPAARRPDHPAIVFDGQEVSYARLWHRARSYAAVLGERGVRPGDRVALLLSNTPHFAMAYFGALAAGAVVVPVHALLKAEEIAYVLRDSGARLLVCGGAFLGEGTKAAEMAGVEVLTVLAPGEPAARRLDLLAERSAPVETYLPRAPADAAVVLYTSGTTGRPKGAVLTHLNLTMNIGVTMLSPFDFHAGDVLLCPLPLFHTFGQICGMGVCFRAGATMVLMPSFDAEEALELMCRHPRAVFMGVPTMYLALLDAARARRAPGRPLLARAYSGGSALPVKVLEEVEEVFDCPVYEGYGLTETSPVVAYNQPGLPRRPGTVGLPVWGVRVAVTAADTAEVVPLPPGEVGEVVVRGHNVMAGYLGRPEATAEVLVDGWFRTGDLGVLDEEGRLTLVDRKKDMVVRGGYNVYPREVEEVLSRHPAIAQVAVIGVPHPRYGEEVCAVVRTPPGTDGTARLGAEIVAWSRERLAGHKYPRRVEFVDSFPLGPSGKVLKRELAARFAA